MRTCALVLLALSSGQALHPFRQVMHRPTLRRPAPIPLAVFDGACDEDIDESEGQRRALMNSAIIGSLALVGTYLIMRNDVDAIASLYAQPDWSIPEVSSRLEVTIAVLQRLPSDWLGWYDAEALARPVLTKAATSSVCYYAGDLIAQITAGRTLESVDLGRSTRSAAAGFIGHGPVAHYWLQFVDSALSFDGAWWAFAPKILLDQGPMSIVYNTIYTVLIGAFAARPPAKVWTDVRETWWPGMQASIRFWPIVHLLTFSPLIPLELKLLWIDLMKIVWISILARVNARETDQASR